MKQNIGQELALYPTPATVVGTVGEGGKVNWLLVAHVGIVSHSKLLLSVHSSHHSVKAIDETKRLSINIIDEAFVSAADYTGTVSGAKTDKSTIFPYHLGEAGMPVIEQSPLVMECEVIDTYEIDGFKNYICTVLNTYVEEDKLDEKGKPDYVSAVAFPVLCVAMAVRGVCHGKIRVRPNLCLITDERVGPSHTLHPKSLGED